MKTGIHEWGESARTKKSIIDFRKQLHFPCPSKLLFFPPLSLSLYFRDTANIVGPTENEVRE